MVQTGSGRAPTRREAQGAASRERILGCAAALMADRGFAGTSISAVSKRSGLPASSIYWHFGSKEGLLREVVEDGAERWHAGLPRWDQLSGTRAERAEVMLDATARSLETHPEFLRLLFLIALERREIDAESLETIRRVRERALNGLRNVVLAVRAEGDPDELAGFALAVADGIFLQLHIDPANTDVARLFKLLGRALRGLGATQKR